MSDDSDRTASLMTPARLAQLKLQARPASPSAYLDQLAADAGSGHARRMMELRQQLETLGRERSTSSLATALRAIRDQLPRLDFSLLEPKGWLARATGKGREAASGFVIQQDRIAHGIDDLREELAQLLRKQQAQAEVSDRALEELEAETQAIEKIIDQGSRWLQDMRNQLRLRQQKSPDAAEQRKIQEDTQRCELLVARIKVLRGANSAARHAQEICQAGAVRRQAFVQAVQQALDGDCAAWRTALAPIAAEAAQTGTAGSGLEAARRAQETLQIRLSEVDRECAAVRAAEDALVEELAVLVKPLEAAG